MRISTCCDPPSQAVNDMDADSGERDCIAHCEQTRSADAIL